MKKIAEILRERRGVSLIECLCSLVIFTLLVSMITVMATGAAKTLQSGKEVDARADEAINALAHIPDKGGAPEGGFVFEAEGGEKIPVKAGMVSASGEGGITLYKFVTEGDDEAEKGA